MKKTLIHLILSRPNGRDSGAEIKDDDVTPAMLDAAEDLLHTLTTGQRLFPKDFYDVCARAFGTTRGDAKDRLIGAMYGAARERPAEPTLLGWTWKAHLVELHDDVREKRWLKASKTLALMLGHALNKVGEAP